MSMSQTILIEDNSDINNLFTLNLQSYAGTNVIHRKNAEDAIELLKILPMVNLIIARNKIQGEETIEKLYDYIKTAGLDIPLICLGTHPLEAQVTVLKEPILWENVVRTAAKILGVNLTEVAKRLKPDFVPVNLQYFYEIQETPCDVYIRIKKSTTEFQYVKRIHSKDTFNFSDIEKYEQSGLKEFFISKDYEQYFVNFISSKIMAKLEDNMSAEQRLVTTGISYDLVNEQIVRAGMLDDTTVELSDSSIVSMVKSVKESPKLNKLLSFLFTSKISYAYQRCHMVTVICHYILSKLELSKPQHLDLLSFISFFSDITLKTRSQIEINSLEELEMSDLSDEEKYAVTYHARDAARILKQHPEAPQGIEQLILEQHGRKDGVGFADDPPEDLHNLTKIFMVADGFVKFSLKPGVFKDKSDLVNALYNRFKGPSYHKIIKVLEGKIE
jgi:hypothetical protein